MRKFAINNRLSSIGGEVLAAATLRVAKNITYRCGLHGYKRMVFLCLDLADVHRSAKTQREAVDKHVKKAVSYTQATQFLCTVIRKFRSKFASVDVSFVHTIHIPYIYENNLNKGVL